MQVYSFLQFPPKGSLFYSSLNGELYVSSGTRWIKAPTKVATIERIPIIGVMDYAAQFSRTYAAVTPSIREDFKVSPVPGAPIKTATLTTTLPAPPDAPYIAHPRCLQEIQRPGDVSKVLTAGPGIHCRMSMVAESSRAIVFERSSDAVRSYITAGDYAFVVRETPTEEATLKQGPSEIISTLPVCPVTPPRDPRKKDEKEVSYVRRIVYPPPILSANLPLLLYKEDPRIPNGVVVPVEGSAGLATGFIGAPLDGMRCVVVKHREGVASVLELSLQPMPRSLLDLFSEIEALGARETVRPSPALTD